MKLLLSLLTTFTLFFIGVSPVSAQSITPTPRAGAVRAPTCLESTFGCIPTNPAQLVGVILQIVIGFAGGIAFLMMVWGSIKLVTSGGNPESISQGKEYITYAILGMLLIVFSVFILSLIGVKILKIPGLG